jgi:hypothetical protein
MISARHWEQYIERRAKRQENGVRRFAPDEIRIERLDPVSTFLKTTHPA